MPVDIFAAVKKPFAVVSCRPVQTKVVFPKHYFCIPGLLFAYEKDKKRGNDHGLFERRQPD